VGTLLCIALSSSLPLGRSVNLSYLSPISFSALAIDPTSPWCNNCPSIVSLCVPRRVGNRGFFLPYWRPEFVLFPAVLPFFSFPLCLLQVGLLTLLAVPLFFFRLVLPCGRPDCSSWVQHPPLFPFYRQFLLLFRLDLLFASVPFFFPLFCHDVVTWKL